MTGQFNLSKPNRTIHVGVILMGGETEVLDVAPVDMFNALDKRNVKDFPDFVMPAELKEQALDINFHWVNETGKTAKLTVGMTVEATDDFESCPPLDVCIMGAHNLAYKPNEKELEFIRKSYDNSSAFITICGGFMAAHDAGLFEGKTVTAPREMLPMLRQSSPGVNWQEKRWERDGKLWTSGALLNGMDLMRVFAQETWGKETGLIDWAVEVGHWPKRSQQYDQVAVK